MRVIPRHACFPAQAEVEREIGSYLPGVLYKRATVTRAGIQKLQGRLRVAARTRRRANQKIRKIAAGRVAIKDEVAIGTGVVAFVDLQVAGFAAKLQRVFAHRLGEDVACHIGVIRLVRVERWNANLEVIEVNLWDIFRISGSRGGDNAEATSNETERRQFGETPGRIVLMQRRSEEADPGLVDGRGPEGLGVAHHELLSPRRSVGRKAGHAGKW